MTFDESEAVATVEYALNPEDLDDVEAFREAMWRDPPRRASGTRDGHRRRGHEPDLWPRPCVDHV
jgi:hypothetical protein